MTTLTDVRDIIKQMMWIDAIGLKETYDILAIRLDIRIPVK